MGKVVYHWDDLRYTAFDSAPHLRLTAIAGVDSFYYSVSDAAYMPCSAKGYHADRKYHFFDKPLGYLGQLIGDDDLLFADFDQVQIAVRGVPFIVLKPEESDHETVVHRLQEVTDISHADEIFTDITDEGIVVAFALPQRFAQEVHAWFSGASIIHAMSALMMCTLRLSRTIETPMMLVNVSAGLVELVVCQSGRLFHTNHYRITGPEDVLYYVLAVVQNLKMQHDQIVVHCSGPEVLHALPVLQTYLPHTHLFTYPDINPRSDYPAVDTADLICISKCAS